MLLKLDIPSQEMSIGLHSKTILLVGPPMATAIGFEGAFFGFARNSTVPDLQGAGRNTFLLYVGQSLTLSFLKTFNGNLRASFLKYVTLFQLIFLNHLFHSEVLSPRKVGILTRDFRT